MGHPQPSWPICNKTYKQAPDSPSVYLALAANNKVRRVAHKSIVVVAVKGKQNNNTLWHVRTVNHLTNSNTPTLENIKWNGEGFMQISYWNLTIFVYRSFLLPHIRNITFYKMAALHTGSYLLVSNNTANKH